MVYRSDRYDGCWVAAVDHGTWVEEKFYKTWNQAIDHANYMTYLIRAGCA